MKLTKMIFFIVYFQLIVDLQSLSLSTYRSNELKNEDIQKFQKILDSNSSTDTHTEITSAHIDSLDARKFWTILHGKEDEMPKKFLGKEDKMKTETNSKTFNENENENFSVLEGKNKPHTDKQVNVKKKEFSKHESYNNSKINTKPLKTEVKETKPYVTNPRIQQKKQERNPLLIFNDDANTSLNEDLTAKNIYKYDKSLKDDHILYLLKLGIIPRELLSVYGIQEEEIDFNKWKEDRENSQKISKTYIKNRALYFS